MSSSVIKSTIFDGEIVGYDPGGNNKHGLSILNIKNGNVNNHSVTTYETVELVIHKILSLQNVIAIGVDTLTCWSTGSSGWRPADRWLRQSYPTENASIVSGNSLYSSMSINGMSVLIILKSKYPDIYITETHPKILYYHLTSNRYEYFSNKHSMDNFINNLFGTSVQISNEHEWDACISSFAAIQSFLGKWQNDLHSLPLSKMERLIKPCGKTYYCWP